MEKITLIIGAGASKDINPEIGVGADLIRDIADRVTDRTSPLEPNLSNILQTKGLKDKHHQFTLPILSNFVYQLDNYILSSKNPSIDEFLNEIRVYPEYEKVKDDFLFIGYLAIFFHILGYEQQANNAIRNPVQWLFTLKNFINEYEILSDSPKKDLRIVTFNYDRIIEHFLYTQYYDYKDKLKEFNINKIVHVYKRLGSLDWETSLKENQIPFGLNNNDVNTYKKHIYSINLMYQDRGSSDEITQAKEILNESDSIICFGYGFDQFNNNLLELYKLNTLENKFKVNIYPENDPNFVYRREMENKVRNILPKADIYYKSCTDFLNSCLFHVNS